MITLTPENTAYLHALLTDHAKTCEGIRDIGLLESAVYAQNASFFGVDRYPTPLEKASRLFYSLVSNHAFADGNKRVGLLAYLVTLSLNGYILTATDDELITLTLSLASGKTSYEELFFFTKSHVHESLKENC